MQEALDSHAAAAAAPELRAATEAYPLSHPFVWLLLSVVAVLATVGALAEFAYFRGALSSDAVAFLSLSAENNLPTWYASCLLFWCATSLADIGLTARASGTSRAQHWLSLAALFLYISLDEAVEIHEQLGNVIGGRGLLYFSWVIPAAAIVMALAVVYLRFVLTLPRSTRNRFMAAGFLYVGGALFMELPLGAWTEQHGDDNFVYAALDLVEETLELVGASLFLAALHAHRRAMSEGASG